MLQFTLHRWWQAKQAKLQKEAEEEAERLEKAERAARMPRHQDLELEVLAEDLDESELSTWKTLQDALAEENFPKLVGSLEQEVDINEAQLDRAREELVEELKGLVVTSRAKVCKVRRDFAPPRPPAPRTFLSLMGILN